MRFPYFISAAVGLFFIADFAVASCSQSDIVSFKGWNVTLIKTSPSPSESKSFFFQAAKNGSYIRVSDIVELSTQKSMALDKNAGQATVNRDCSVDLSFQEPPNRVDFNAPTPAVLISNGGLGKGKDTIMGSYSIYRDFNTVEEGTLMAIKNPL
jgi:hypothetical protein